MARNASVLGLGSFVPLISHLFLLTFTWLLVLKLDGRWTLSWWVVFMPLWLFHALLVRCNCSMPAPTSAHDRQWSPCHTLLVLPLFLAFEILLCCFLAAMEGPAKSPPMNLFVVFFPLVLLQAVVLFDNVRMCMVLMPGEDEDMTDEALWETLPHFAIAVAMVFFMAATIFGILKVTDIDDEVMDDIDWWTLFVDLCVGEFFAFLLCTKWVNPHAPPRPALTPLSPSHAISVLPSFLPSLPSSLSSPATPLLSSTDTTTPESGGIQEDATSAPPARSAQEENPSAATEGRSPRSERSDDSDSSPDFSCGAPEIGGHFMKAGVVFFQLLLCMRLEGQPGWAASMPYWILFSPLFVVQLAAVASGALQLVEALLLRYSSVLGQVASVVAREYDPFMFVTRGMRLAGWWWRDDEAKEEQRTITSGILPGFECDATPPEHIRKMRKTELAEEVVRLQSALIDTVEASKANRQELENVQQEKILCRVCFERDISLVLLPCRHRVLCFECSEKCKQCPICRAFITEKMAVFDV